MLMKFLIGVVMFVFFMVVVNFVNLFLVCFCVRCRELVVVVVMGLSWV